MLSYCLASMVWGGEVKWSVAQVQIAPHSESDTPRPKPRHDFLRARSHLNSADSYRNSLRVPINTRHAREQFENTQPSSTYTTSVNHEAYIPRIIDLNPSVLTCRPTTPSRETSTTHLACALARPSQHHASNNGPDACFTAVKSFRQPQSTTCPLTKLTLRITIQPSTERIHITTCLWKQCSQWRYITLQPEFAIWKLGFQHRRRRIDIHIGHDQRTRTRIGLSSSTGRIRKRCCDARA